MRKASSLSRLHWAGLAGLLLLVACQRFVPLIVVNQSDQPIRVKVGDTRQPNGSGGFFLCRLDEQDVRVAPEGEKLTGASPAVAYLSRDMEKCEVEFELPARHQASVSVNGSCSGYEKHLARNPQMTATPDFLRIVGSQGSIELRGWQVAQRFKDRGDRCVMIYR